MFRSTSGKTGTYLRIAVVKEDVITDKGLQPGETYYYKVRAYTKQDGKYVYGAFAKANQIARG